MGLSRQEYWNGLPCPPPEDLPNPGTEFSSPTLQVDSLPSEPLDKPTLPGEEMVKNHDQHQGLLLVTLRPAGYHFLGGLEIWE